MTCKMRANSSLKPNRDLINTRFEGYKYTTTSHTVNSTSLPGPVCRARETGYDYQMTKRTCLFNHLSYRNNTSYFVCKVGSVSSGGVGSVSSDGVGSVSSGEVDSVSSGETVALYSYIDGRGIVKEIEFSQTSLKTNISVFTCGERIYLNLGMFLLVLERVEGRWKVTQTHTLNDDYMLLKVLLSEGRVLVVTCTKDKGYKHKFYHLSSNKLELFHTIECSGIASLVTLTDNQLTLIVEGHLITEETTPDVRANDQKIDEQEIKETKRDEKKDYSWSQSMEDVEVVVPLPKGLVKNDLCVDIGVQTVEVTTAGGQKLFEGILFNKIEPQDSFWQLNDNSTECVLHLSKYQQAHNWSCLLREEEKKEDEEDRTRPLLNDISDLDHGELEAMMDRIRSLDQFTSARLDTSPYHTAHHEVEEVDEIHGSLISLLTYTVSDTELSSDKIMELAPGSLLFTILQDIGDSIVVTHNIDALVYKCILGVWTHSSTLQAFNHIQASKTQKKFMIAPDTGTYVAIVDTTRNIFVYRTTSSNNGKLTVLGLEEDNEIIGSVALSKSIILLTTQSIITVQFEF